jgi:hypothetical protein
VPDECRVLDGRDDVADHTGYLHGRMLVRPKAIGRGPKGQPQGSFTSI